MRTRTIAPKAIFLIMVDWETRWLRLGSIGELVSHTTARRVFQPNPIAVGLPAPNGGTMRSIHCRNGVVRWEPGPYRALPFVVSLSNHGRLTLPSPSKEGGGWAIASPSSGRQLLVSSPCRQGED